MLYGGGSTSNLERICRALEISPGGSDTRKKRRIEMTLRKRSFASFDGFVPTDEHARFELDAFNEKFEKVKPHTIGVVVAALREFMKQRE